MAFPFKGKTHDLLEVGAHFLYDNRPGTVFEVREEGYLVHWDNWVDRETGKSVAARDLVLSHESALKADSYGKLVVLRWPGQDGRSPNVAPERKRTKEEYGRMRWRYASVTAATELIAQDRMRDRRDDFVRHKEEIAERADALILKWAREAASGGATKASARCGVSIDLRHQDKGGRTTFDWLALFKAGGRNKLFDDYSACGLAPYHCPDAVAIVNEVVGQLFDMECQSIASLTTSVKARIHAENVLRRADPTRGPFLKSVGRDYVSSVIDRIAPVEHAIRRGGLKVAYKDMHSVGSGVKRPRGRASGSRSTSIPPTSPSS